MGEDAIDGGFQLSFIKGEFTIDSVFLLKKIREVFGRLDVDLHSWVKIEVPRLGKFSELHGNF